MSAPRLNFPYGTGGGGGGGVSGFGTAGKLPLWGAGSPSTTLTDSRVADDGTTVTVGSGAYAGSALPGGVQLRTSVPIYVATDGVRNTIVGTDGSTACFVGSLTAHDFQVRAGNANAITVQQTTLNVGVGNPSPNTKLHVGSGTTATPVLARVQTQGLADQAPVLSLFRSGVTESALWVPPTAATALSIALNPAGYTDAQLTTAARVNITSGGGVQATGTSLADIALGATNSKAGIYFPTTPANTIRFAAGTSPSLVGQFDASGNFAFNSGYGSAATAYGCRAWVDFNGQGVVAINGSGNVSSITDNGTGNYTVNFTTAMPDTTYAYFGATRREIAGFGESGVTPGLGDTKTTSALQIRTCTGSTAFDYPEVTLMIVR